MPYTCHNTLSNDPSPSSYFAYTVIFELYNTFHTFYTLHLLYQTSYCCNSLQFYLWDWAWTILDMDRSIPSFINNIKIDNVWEHPKKEIETTSLGSRE